MCGVRTMMVNDCDRYCCSPTTFEGVGESSEGRTRSAKTVRRTTETGSSPVSTPLGHRSSCEQHPGASNLSLADALRLRLEPASSPPIAYDPDFATQISRSRFRDPRFDVAGSMRSRRHSSEPKGSEAAYFFFLRFVVLRAVFFAADLVFDLAFFAMLPS